MFEESKNNGEYGEHTVWNLLMKTDDVRSVVDVRNDKHFQECDIDFLVENNKRQFTAVEVKTDFKAHETGNLVYELSTSGNVGCFEKTKAKFIFYYIPRLRVVYVLSVSLLRKYVNERDLEAVKMGDYATGYLIPITDLEKTGVIKRTYKGVF